MIKARTMNAPARTASGMVSHQETERERYIRYHNSAKGTSVLAICQDPFQKEGTWYSATIFFHSAVSGWDPPASDSLLSFIIYSCHTTGDAPAYFSRHVMRALSRS
jgi:hypothetical protein